MKTEKRFEFMNRFASGKVLDVGYNSIPNKLIEIDVGIDTEAIKKPKNYKNVMKMNCEDMDFPDNFFDTILAGEVYEHLERPIDFLKECKRVLKDDGLLVVTTPNPYYFPIIFSRLFQTKKFTRNDHISETNIQYMHRNLLKAGFFVKNQIGTRFNYHIIYVCGVNL